MDGPTSIDAYFAGTKLYGDDFCPRELQEWFEDESDSYFSLEPRDTYSYGYSALNWFHGYRFLPVRTFRNVLGIGSAFGHELEPIVRRAEQVTILEPSNGFQNPRFKYVEPQPSGIMPFADGTFDLVVCFGVLHHIANVTTVVKEVCRVLRKDAFCLLREPIVSLGDWTRPRKGLTKRERGIPIDILRRMISDNEFEVLRERRCMFSLTSRLSYVLGGPAYNSGVAVLLDDIVCRRSVWSEAYHARSWIQKLKPTSVFYVLRKRE